MSPIIRKDVHDDWAHAGIIKVGDFCFLSYCVGNVGGTVEEQINGAFDEMERRLRLFGLTLENVVQMDCLSSQGPSPRADVVPGATAGRPGIPSCIGERT